MELVLECCRVDLTTRKVFYDQGEKRLTGTETALLSYLVDRSPDIISREELYREVWEHSVSLQTRTLDLAVLRLRKKIEADPKDPVHILNVYGKGYCFVPSGGQTGSFRPVASTKPHSNLELEGNVFVGREDELKQLDELVSGGSRLTTILGPGGTGKTRLARHWASGQLGAGSIGGVFFCDITEARDLPCLLRIVTTVLGLEVTGRAEDSSQLVREIREELQKLSKPLVIFDNAEQVAAELRLMLQVLMGEESESLFVVTSQVALGLPSEQRFPLDPLPAPSQDSSELKHCPSIELFVERARLIRPDFELTEDNQAIIASIVTELDCLPLAIELAAARVGMMTPATIHKRLDERFRLLRQTHTDGSGKHQTLEAALRWSWDLLGEDEQSTLAQCAVFRGGFDWEAAEAVVEVMPGGGSPWAVDLIAALVEHSLVIVRHDHAAIAHTLTQHAFQDRPRHRDRRTAGIERAQGEMAAHDDVGPAHRDELFERGQLGLAPGLRNIDKPIMAVAARPAMAGEMLDGTHSTGGLVGLDEGAGIGGDRAAIRTVGAAMAADHGIVRIVRVGDRREIHVEACCAEFRRAHRIEFTRLVRRAVLGHLHGARDVGIAQIAGQALHQPALLVDRHPGGRIDLAEAPGRAFGPFARADIVAQEEHPADAPVSEMVGDHVGALRFRTRPDKAEQQQGRQGERQRSRRRRELDDGTRALLLSHGAVLPG